MQVDSKMIAAVLATAGFAVASSFPASAQFSSTVAAQDSGKCLDVNAWQTRPGLPMEQWSCNNRANQKFSFAPTGNGSYLIHPQIDGLCLDVDGSGWQVIQNSCNGSVSQQWTPKPIGNGAYNLTASHGACLNVSGSSAQDGAHMILYGCNSDSNERFTVRVPGSTSAPTPPTTSDSQESYLTTPNIPLPGPQPLNSAVVLPSGLSFDGNGGTQLVGMDSARRCPTPTLRPASSCAMSSLPPRMKAT